MFDDLAFYLVLLFFGFIWGWFAREMSAINRIKKIMDDNPELTADKLESMNMIPIKIERHNDTYYVYSIKDKTFMAQGKTKDLLEDNLAKRFPGKRFAVLPENLKEIGFDHEPL